MAEVIIHRPTRQARTVGNIFCIGRNYAAHIAELGNRPEEDPIVFLKPTSALLHEPSPIVLPTFSNDVHYETELVLLIGKGGKNIEELDAWGHIEAYGLGLDLTARDIQSKCKAGGLPWTPAKGFDGAACVSEFIAASEVKSPELFEFSMHKNGELKQHGDVRKMLFPIPFIIHYLSTVFTLQAGDLIFTGTPEGVGPLNSGDELVLTSGDHLRATFKVTAG